MAAFTDLDDLVAKMTGANTEQVWFNKSPYLQASTTVAPGMTNVLTSMWEMLGSPAAGVKATTSPVAPDKDTQGALPFTNASGGRQKFIVQARALSLSGWVMIYDRLLHMSGLSLTTSPVAVGGTLTRNTGGEGNEIWVEQTHTALSTNTRFPTFSYTNQDGTSGRSTSPYEFGNEGPYPSTIHRIPLQAGDTGVRSIETVVWNVAPSAADYTVIIARPLLNIAGPGKQLFEGPYPIVEDGACLAIARRTVQTNSSFLGCLSMVES